MQLTSRMNFAERDFVTDCFHVVKLVIDVLQYLRIKYRWEAIEKKSTNFNS